MRDDPPSRLKRRPHRLRCRTFSALKAEKTVLLSLDDTRTTQVTADWQFWMKLRSPEEARRTESTAKVPRLGRNTRRKCPARRKDRNLLEGANQRNWGLHQKKKGRRGKELFGWRSRGRGIGTNIKLRLVRKDR